MTVAISKAKIIYAGNGSATQWDIPFPFGGKDDLQVYIVQEDGALTRLAGDFTVDTDLNAIIYPAPQSQTPPLSEGKKLLILRRTPLAQQAAFSAQRAFDPFVLEEGYDKAMMIAQEQAEELSRAVKFPVTAAEGQTDAAAYLQDLEQAKTAAGAANTLAQKSVATAQEAVQTASEAAAGAQAAVNTLQGYMDGTAEAETAARTAKAGAEAAKADALVARDAAQSAKKDAEAAKSGAQSAQSAAQNSASLAAASQTAAASSASAAQNSASAALSSQSAASSYAETAQDWAVKTSGAVSGGEYSAKKYALDASASAGAAAQSAAEAQAYGILPVGMVVSGVMTSAPTGFLLCNGQAVSRTQYAALFAVIGAAFGSGNGSTTFNVPDYRGCFLRGLGGASGTMYQKQPMGAPDITGQISCDGAANKGAFSCPSDDGSYKHDGWKYNNILIDFNASASNSVYGAADEIRPVNFAVNYFIKY